MRAARLAFMRECERAHMRLAFVHVCVRLDKCAMRIVHSYERSLRDAGCDTDVKFCSRTRTRTRTRTLAHVKLRARTDARVHTRA